jgi:hypothetical protein
MKHQKKDDLEEMKEPAVIKRYRLKSPFSGSRRIDPVVVFRSVPDQNPAESRPINAHLNRL